MISRAVIAHGQVQGVGFRYSCAESAQQHGVVGWVRNRGDGTVEALFEGPQDAVDAMTEWMRTGPPWAQVTSITTTDVPSAGARTFEIRG